MQSKYHASERNKSESERNLNIPLAAHENPFSYLSFYPLYTCRILAHISKSEKSHKSILLDVVRFKMEQTKL